MHTAEGCLLRAEEIVRLAARATDPEQKARILELAAWWRKRAAVGNSVSQNPYPAAEDQLSELFAQPPAIADFGEPAMEMRSYSGKSVPRRSDELAAASVFAAAILMVLATVGFFGWNRHVGQEQVQAAAMQISDSQR